MKKYAVAFFVLNECPRSASHSILATSTVSLYLDTKIIHETKRFMNFSGRMSSSPNVANIFFMKGKEGSIKIFLVFTQDNYPI